jgi:hypothetical protein
MLKRVHREREVKVTSRTCAEGALFGFSWESAMAVAET